MSRSGYNEDWGWDWDLIRWRGQVASAIRGRRGQAFLWELIAALDSMPEKRLIAHDLRKDGEVCALGAVGQKRGINLEKLNPEDHCRLGDIFNIAYQLVQEVEYMNDECVCNDTLPDAAERRWQNMRAWAAKNINYEFVEIDP